MYYTDVNCVYQGEKTQEKWKILTYFMLVCPDFPMPSMEEWQTNIWSWWIQWSHFSLDCICLHPLFCQVSTLYIIKTYFEDVFLGYELTVPFQWFSSIFQVLCIENTSFFYYYCSYCCLFSTGFISQKVHHSQFMILIGKTSPNLMRCRRSLKGFFLEFILKECRHWDKEVRTKDRIIYKCVQVQHLNIGQKKLELLQMTFIISFEGQLGSVLNSELSDAVRLLLHNNKHGLSHWTENNHNFTLESIF